MEKLPFHWASLCTRRKELDFYSTCCFNSLSQDWCLNSISQYRCLKFYNIKCKKNHNILLYRGLFYKNFIEIDDFLIPPYTQLELFTMKFVRFVAFFIWLTHYNFSSRLTHHFSSLVIMWYKDVYFCTSVVFASIPSNWKQIYTV